MLPGRPLVVSDWTRSEVELRLRDWLNSEGPYPSLDELIEECGVNELRGPTRRIMLRYPTQPNLDAWFDQITPEAQKRAILLDWDANGLDASMGWCHLLVGGPRWPDLPSIRYA